MVVYLACILGLLERRPGVVVFALAWTGLHLAFNAYLFAAMALAAYRGAIPLAEPTAKVGPAIAGLWVAAIGQLEWHLAQSIKGIRYDMAGHADAGAEPAGYVVQR